MAPPRSFLLLEFFEIKKRNVGKGLTTRRAALGAADLERPAGETPPPPRRDLPRAVCVWQLLDGRVTRLNVQLFGNIGTFSFSIIFWGDEKREVIVCRGTWDML